jgi:hypothetical protein
MEIHSGKGKYKLLHMDLFFYNLLLLKLRSLKVNTVLYTKILADISRQIQYMYLHDVPHVLGSSSRLQQ